MDNYEKIDLLKLFVMKGFTVGEAIGYVKAIDAELCTQPKLCQCTSEPAPTSRVVYDSPCKY